MDLPHTFVNSREAIGAVGGQTFVQNVLVTTFNFAEIFFSKKLAKFSQKQENSKTNYLGE
jgi:hypothetical protein